MVLERDPEGVSNAHRVRHAASGSSCSQFNGYEIRRSKSPIR